MAIGTSTGEEFPSKLEEVLSNMDKSASVEPSGQNPIDAGRVIRNKALDQFRDENEIDINSPATNMSKRNRYVQADPQSSDTPGSDMEYRKQTPPTYSGEITDSWNAIAPFRGKMVDPWTLSPNDMRDYLQEQQKKQEENFPFREKLPDVPVRPGDSPPPPAKNPRRPMAENRPSVIQVADTDIRTLFPHMPEDERKAWEQSPPRDLQFEYKGKSNILDIPKTLDSKGHEDGLFVDQLHPDILKLNQDEYDIRFVPNHEIFHIRKKPKPPLVGEADLPENAQPAQFLYSNASAADSEMKLSPQEKNLYDTHLRNLIGPGGVDNEDGSRSTVKSMMVDFDDRTFVIPSVYNGKLLDQDEAIAKAKELGLNKFPSYDSREEAEARYDQLHKYMEKDTNNYQEAHTVYKGIVNLLTDYFKTPGQEMQKWSGKEILGYMLSTGLGLVGPGLKGPTPTTPPRVDAVLSGKDMGISNVNVGQMATAANSNIPGLGKAHSAMTMVERKAMDDYLSLDVGFTPKNAYERAVDNQKAGRMNPTGDSVEDFINSSRKRREDFMSDSESRRADFLSKKPNLTLVDKTPPQEPQGRPIPGEQARTQEAQRAANDRNYQMGKDTERVNVGQGRGVLNDNKEEVMALIHKGASPSEVARKYDITPMAVRNWIKRNGRINTIEDILKE